MSVAVKLQTLRYELEIIKGPHAGKKYSFEYPSVTIGREATNQVSLPQDLRVSRLHAEIRNNDGELYFVNRSQKNYVLVDGARAEFQQLKNESIISIGETEIKVRFAADAQPAAAPAPVVLAKPNIAPAPVISAVPQNLSMPRPSPMARPQINNQYSEPFRNQPETNKSMRNIFIVVAVGLVIYFLFFDGPKKSKKNAPIRGGDIIEKEMQESQEKIEVLEAKVKAQNNLTNKRAEENFIKGFRDYQKGQYLRAKEYFRIVLNLNAQHIEARKYYEQATIKHKKQMEFNFLEGLKNKDKKNYRLCKAFFSQVLVLAQGDRTGYEKYEEAEKYLRECNLGLEGGY